MGSARWEVDRVESPSTIFCTDNFGCHENGRSGGTYGSLRDRHRLSGDRMTRHKPEAPSTVTAATLDSIAVMAQILSINHVAFALNDERNELNLWHSHVKK